MARLYVALSLHTHIPFRALLAEDDATVATYLDLIAARSEE